jgi:hypothetical protein
MGLSTEIRVGQDGVPFFLPVGCLLSKQSTILNQPCKEVLLSASIPEPCSVPTSPHSYEVAPDVHPGSILGQCCLLRRPNNGMERHLDKPGYRSWSASYVLGMLLSLLSPPYTMGLTMSTLKGPSEAVMCLAHGKGQIQIGCGNDWSQPCQQYLAGASS